MKATRDSDRARLRWRGVERALDVLAASFEMKDNHFKAIMERQEAALKLSLKQLVELKGQSNLLKTDNTELRSSLESADIFKAASLSAPHAKVAELQELYKQRNLENAALASELARVRGLAALEGSIVDGYSSRVVQLTDTIRTGNEANAGLPSAVAKLEQDNLQLSARLGEAQAELVTSQDLERQLMSVVEKENLEKRVLQQQNNSINAGLEDARKRNTLLVSANLALEEENEYLKSILEQQGSGTGLAYWTHVQATGDHHEANGSMAVPAQDKDLSSATSGRGNDTGQKSFKKRRMLFEA